MMRHGYIFGLCFALFLLLITFLIGYRLPVWLGGGADIQHDATVYFLIFSLIIPFHLIEYMSAAMLKVSGDMRRPSFYGDINVCVGCYFQLLLYFSYTHSFSFWSRGDDAGFG